MALETWLTFVAVSFALLGSPGPITLLTASYALSLGRARAAVIIPGALLGDFVAMSASLYGVGLIVGQFPQALSALKLCGAGVLIWLGYKALSQSNSEQLATTQSSNVSLRTVFWSGFALSALHPSGFVFFTSFAPQFVAQERPFFVQALMLTVTFLTIGGLTLFAWLFVADKGRRLFGDARSRILIRHGSGVILIVLGALSFAQWALKN